MSVSLETTVTLQDAAISPALAVIVTVPTFFVTIIPSDTVAMLSSEEVQVTVLSVAFPGLTVTVR